MNKKIQIFSITLIMAASFALGDTLYNNIKLAGNNTITGNLTVSNGGELHLSNGSQLIIDAGASIPGNMVSIANSSLLGANATGGDTSYPFTSVGLMLLNETSASSARTDLGVAIGTNVQAYSANLSAFAGLTPTTTGLNYAALANPGAGTWFVTLTGNAPATRSAANFRSDLGLGAIALLSAVDLTANVAGLLPGANGGTGANNSGKSITLGGNLTTGGAYNLTFTSTANGNFTLPNANGTIRVTGWVPLSENFSANFTGNEVIAAYNTTSNASLFNYAARLPAAANVVAGTSLLIADTAGNLSIQRILSIREAAGSNDTINGITSNASGDNPIVFASPNEAGMYLSDGASNWAFYPLVGASKFNIVLAPGGYTHPQASQIVQIGQQSTEVGPDGITLGFGSTNLIQNGVNIGGFGTTNGAPSDSIGDETGYFSLFNGQLGSYYWFPGPLSGTSLYHQDQSKIVDAIHAGLGFDFSAPVYLVSTNPNSWGERDAAQVIGYAEIVNGSVASVNMIGKAHPVGGTGANETVVIWNGGHGNGFAGNLTIAGNVITGIGVANIGTGYIGGDLSGNTVHNSPARDLWLDGGVSAGQGTPGSVRLRVALANATSNNILNFPLYDGLVVSPNNSSYAATITMNGPTTVKTLSANAFVYSNGNLTLSSLTTTNGTFPAQFANGSLGAQAYNATTVTAVLGPLATNTTFGGTNSLLYSTSAGTLGGAIASANNGYVVTNATGTPVVLTSGLPGINTNTAPVVAINSIGASETEGLRLWNQSAATSGAQVQNSPALGYSGRAWNGTASLTGNVYLQENVTGGSGSIGQVYQIGFSNAGGAIGWVYFLNTAGNLSINGTLSTTHGDKWDFQNYDGVSAANVTINGTAYALAATAISDPQWKIHAHEVNDLWNVIHEVQVRAWDWSDDHQRLFPDAPRHVPVGLWAPNIERLAPELVTTTIIDGKPTKTLKEWGLLPYAIGGLQDLNAQLAEIRARDERIFVLAVAAAGALLLLLLTQTWRLHRRTRHLRAKWWH